MKQIKEYFIRKRSVLGCDAVLLALMLLAVQPFLAWANETVVLSDGTRFSPSYYEAQNQDVSALIQEGKYASFEDHYLKVGFKEGRLPYEGAPDVTPSRIIQATNTARQERGLSNLVTDPALCAIAQVRADEIANTGLTYFGHTRPNGQSWKSVYDERGYQASLRCENLEWNDYLNSHGAKEVVQMWLNSPTHAENVLDPSVTKIGVAVAKTADGKVIVAQEFAK